MPRPERKNYVKSVNVPHDVHEEDWEPQLWEPIIECIKTQPSCWGDNVINGKALFGTRWYSESGNVLVFLFFHRIVEKYNGKYRSPTRPFCSSPLVVEVIWRHGGAMQVNPASENLKRDVEKKGGVYMRIPSKYLCAKLSQNTLRDLHLGTIKHGAPTGGLRIQDLNKAIIPAFPIKPGMELAAVETGSPITVGQESSYEMRA